MASHLALWFIFFYFFGRFTRIFGSLRILWGCQAPPPTAQGIEAVSFFAWGKKDTSGKPGPATEVAGCAQNKKMKVPMRLSRKQPETA
jgi:hypothetical protein